MFQYDKILKLPITDLKDWTFNSKVAQVFPNMIHRSIPSYAHIVSMIGILSKNFIYPNSYIYDLGCSLGAVTMAIDANIQVNGCKFIAVDNSPDMIKIFRYNIDKLKLNTPINLLESDVLDISINNTYFVVLNFTLQFLDQEKRLILLRKIFKGLNNGGALIISEKFNFENTKINNFFCKMHYNFKRSNGYSNLEIIQKK